MCVGGEGGGGRREGVEEGRERPGNEANICHVLVFKRGRKEGLIKLALYNTHIQAYTHQPEPGNMATIYTHVMFHVVICVQVLCFKQQPHKDLC